jgi:hypothetical protein
MLRVKFLSDYRCCVLLCCINVRYPVVDSLRLASLPSVTAMLFTLCHSCSEVFSFLLLSVALCPLRLFISQ